MMKAGFTIPGVTVQFEAAPLVEVPTMPENLEEEGDEKLLEKLQEASANPSPVRTPEAKNFQKRMRKKIGGYSELESDSTIKKDLKRR